MPGGGPTPGRRKTQLQDNHKQLNHVSAVFLRGKWWNYLRSAELTLSQHCTAPMKKFHKPKVRRTANVGLATVPCELARTKDRHLRCPLRSLIACTHLTINRNTGQLLEAKKQSKVGCSNRLD